jgi:hypothetical protein
VQAFPRTSFPCHPGGAFPRSARGAFPRSARSAFPCSARSAFPRSACALSLTPHPHPIPRAPPPISCKTQPLTNPRLTLRWYVLFAPMHVAPTSCGLLLSHSADNKLHVHMLLDAGDI